MKLFRQLLFVSACLLLATSATNADASPAQEPITVQLSPASGSTNGTKAVFFAPDSIAVSWRLAASGPSLLQYDRSTYSFVFRTTEGTRVVAPSGAEIDSGSALDLSDGLQVPAGVAVSAGAVTGYSAGSQKQAWNYRLPEGRTVLQGSLHTDGRGRIYFQDNRYDFYSLDRNGNERFVLRFESEPPKVECLAAPNGDAACLSEAFGIIGIREKSDAPRLFINGTERFFSERPLLIKGSIYVPFRALFEALDATVKWDSKSRTVEAMKGKRKVRLVIGQPTATIDGKKIKLPAPPFEQNGTTFVPLRFAGEALGSVVVWEKATRSIQIVTS